MSLDNKLDALLGHYKILSEKIMDPAALGDDYAKISKEYADLGPVIELINEYKKISEDVNDAAEMLKEGVDDTEMKKMLEEEKNEGEKNLKNLTEKIKIALLPKDEADEKNAILEVRAGTGGEEAALFATNLFNMYQRYAEKKGWKFEIISFSETGIGGCKEGTATISGKNVFARLKF